MFVIDNDTCTGCDSCIDACPCDAILIDEEGNHIIDPDMCSDCGACYDVCEYASIFEVDEDAIIPKKDI